MLVDPWAVVIRHGLRYLLGWSRSADARRVLRADRVTAVETRDEPLEPTPDLDPIEAFEAHLSEGWRYAVKVLLEATIEDVAHWLSRSRRALKSLSPDRTLLTGTTDDPAW